MEKEIFSSCYLGYIDKLKDIIEKGGNVNVTDEYDNTLVHSVVKHDHYKLIWYLRKKGVPLDSKNKDGDTPLHIACKNHSINTVRELLKYTSNSRVKNLEGKTSFSYLTEKERENMNDYVDRIYRLGKYEFKPKPEIPHRFGQIR
jgi:ankyrin repeat protein